ncbi:MAG: alpha-glucosidase C-terminal domain-containing protein, partial [Muribaculaceae bacterium]|nr:alpha-glucosidase C-terminal domain-containing protein [Muribaculaceae bacterium]
KKLTHLKHTHPALRTGTQSGLYSTLTTSADDSVYAYKRASGDEEIVVMLNFGDGEADFTVAEGMAEGRYVDALTGKAMDVDAASVFRIPALDAAVFVKQK